VRKVWKECGYTYGQHSELKNKACVLAEENPAGAKPKPFVIENSDQAQVTHMPESNHR
jgi:hypothetical protein